MTPLLYKFATVGGQAQRPNYLEKMKRIKYILLTTTILFITFVFWYWADNYDYFKTKYKDLSAEQYRIFLWQEGDSDEKLKGRFRQHFFDKEYTFPRQKVSRVVLYKNQPLLGIFTGKNLRHERINDFIELCNDTTNYDWGETTWEISESKYVFKLFNSEDEVIGKLYYCSNDCSMTSARPFTPNMKFGKLSSEGLKNIKVFINRKSNWE